MFLCCTDSVNISTATPAERCVGPTTTITLETANVPTGAAPADHNVSIETTKSMSETTDTPTTEPTENVEPKDRNSKFIFYRNMFPLHLQRLISGYSWKFIKMDTFKLYPHRASAAAANTSQW